MSIKLMSRVFDAPPSLNGSNRLTLLVLADHANDEGWCWPGIKGVASKVGVSERQIQYSLTWLEERGCIERHFRPGKTTYYRVMGGEVHFIMKPTSGVKPTSPESLIEGRGGDASFSSLRSENDGPADRDDVSFEPDFEFFEGQLLEAKNPIAVLGDAFGYVFDREPDFGRLGRLARANRPIVVLRAIYAAAVQQVKGDPYAYLAQVIANKAATQSSPEHNYLDRLMAEDAKSMRGAK